MIERWTIPVPTGQAQKALVGIQSALWACVPKDRLNIWSYTPDFSAGPATDYFSIVAYLQEKRNVEGLEIFIRPEVYMKRLNRFRIMNYFRLSSLAQSVQNVDPNFKFLLLPFEAQDIRGAKETLHSKFVYSGVPLSFSGIKAFIVNREGAEWLHKNLMPSLNVGVVDGGYFMSRPIVDQLKGRYLEETLCLP